MLSFLFFAAAGASSIFDFDVKTAEGKLESLSKYSFKRAILIVNTASKCGFTPQYEGLQKLQDTYGAKGFQVLAFPCNQFFKQEPQSDSLIQSNIKTTYGVTFPIYAKIEVNGAKADPLFTYLKQASSDPVAIPQWNGLESSGLQESDVQWNFSKFLVTVNPDGTTSVQRFDYDVEPSALADRIEAAIQPYTEL